MLPQPPKVSAMPIKFDTMSITSLFSRNNYPSCLYLPCSCYARKSLLVYSSDLCIYYIKLLGSDKNKICDLKLSTKDSKNLAYSVSAILRKFQNIFNTSNHSILVIIACNHIVIILSLIFFNELIRFFFLVTTYHSDNVGFWRESHFQNDYNM